MRKTIIFILNKYAKNNAGEIDRKRCAYIEGFVSIIINVVLAAVKIAFGIISASLALIVDGVHSLSDVFTSAVVVIGFKISSKPPDLKHPFGHGRFEPVATLIIAIVLFTVAVEFFQSGISRIITPVKIKVSWEIIIIVLGTVLIKEFTAQFAKHIGREINSKTIEADFWHHRSDTLSTFFVLAGIIGSMYGVLWLDGAAAISVSLFLAWVSVKLIRDTVNALMGTAPSGEFLEQVKKLALSNSRVDGIHDVIVHQYGERVLITLHAEIEDKFTAIEIHDITEELERHIESKIKLSNVTVHADPVNKKHKLYEPVKIFLETKIKELPDFLSFHDLRFAGGQKYPRVLFDVVLNRNICDKKCMEIKKGLINSIYEQFKIVAKIKIQETFKYQVD